MKHKFEVYAALALGIIAFSLFLAAGSQSTEAYIPLNVPVLVELGTTNVPATIIVAAQTAPSQTSTTGDTCTSLGESLAFTTQTNGQSFAFNPWLGSQLTATDYGPTSQANFGTRTFNDYCEDQNTIVKFVCSKDLNIPSLTPMNRNNFAAALSYDCEAGETCKQYTIQNVGSVASCMKQGTTYTFNGQMNIGQDLIFIDYSSGPNMDDWRQYHLEYTGYQSHPLTGTIVTFELKENPSSIVQFGAIATTPGNFPIALGGRIYTASLNTLTGAITLDFCAQLNSNSQVWCFM